MCIVGRSVLVLFLGGAANLPCLQEPQMRRKAGTGSNTDLDRS
jgi:hypothetical protein